MSENPHAGQGMVVLDIGGVVGALVVSVPAELVGTEIEICPAGHRGQTPDEGGHWWVGDWHSHHHHTAAGVQHHDPAWPHVAVLARPAPSGTEWAAVYPGLREGRYELWLRPDGATALTATVQGGLVTAAQWPALAS